MKCVLKGDAEIGIDRNGVNPNFDLDVADSILLAGKEPQLKQR